jgi:uncharacterized protein YecT (DUF1311 family)
LHQPGSKIKVHLLAITSYAETERVKSRTGESTTRKSTSRASTQTTSFTAEDKSGNSSFNQNTTRTQEQTHTKNSPAGRQSGWIEPREKEPDNKSDVGDGDRLATTSMETIGNESQQLIGAHQARERKTRRGGKPVAEQSREEGLEVGARAARVLMARSKNQAWDLP